MICITLLFSTSISREKLRKLEIIKKSRENTFAILDNYSFRIHGKNYGILRHKKITKIQNCKKIREIWDFIVFV